ncbi:MAG: hypothetical protein AAB887_00125 [Patescibacteria group bacterium]
MKYPRFIWIILPVLVFAALLIFFVLRLPQPRSASVTASPSPSPNSQPATLNASPSELQIVVNDIRSFRLDDPELAAPSFSRSLDIPTD